MTLFLSLTITLFYILLNLTITQARLVKIQWTIGYTSANPDGLFERTVVGVNGQWPPQPVIVNAGDLIHLRVINQLNQSTAIHHHGLAFKNSSFYDGAMGITQCGIPPGAEFTYQVDTTGHSGTYWIHAHSNGQYVDGLRAPFLIQPPLRNTPNYFASSMEKNLDTRLTIDTVSKVYDEEYTVIMSDWYHQQHSDLLKTYLSSSNPEGDEPTPNSGLLYFLKGDSYLPGFNDLAQIHFRPGLRYRLRLLNIGALAMFQFKIDGHQMYIIEVDGTDVIPYQVDSIPISVAQRYSILIIAKPDRSSNYIIQANMDPVMLTNPPPTLKLNITSQLIYSPTASLHPIQSFSSYSIFDERVLVPQVSQEILRPTREINLNAAFYMSTDGTNRGFINNVTWIPPNTPTIMTIDSVRGDSVYDPRIYGPQTNLHILNYMDIIDLVVKNEDDGGHPFHLHGHKFQIIDRSSSPIKLNEVNLQNPIRRDTIQIDAGEIVRLRFIANNPGVFLFHCHIEWHLQAGLSITLLEAPDLFQKHQSVPNFMKHQCAQLNLPSQGNAAGKSGDQIFDVSQAPNGPFPKP